MKRGVLADYFAGVVSKRLSRVEADPSSSNQHEFNGTTELKDLLGTPPASAIFPTQFFYFSGSDDEPIYEEAGLTWYDARLKSASRTGRTEWRLYFPQNAATNCAVEGDLLIIARQQDDSLIAVIAEGGSTIANQMQWLFGIGSIGPQFSVREELETERDRLGFSSSLILETLGIAVEFDEGTALDRMLEKFGENLPDTRSFSAFAREEAGDIDALYSPDDSLIAWMNKEDILFRTFEKHLLLDRLQEGFAGDVEGFLEYSKMVQNRRKSRAGLALENHLEEVFRLHQIRFDRSKYTEGKSRPDFIFPGQAEYQDQMFDSSKLTMLAAKSTCKERWRQVLAEAVRIERKHLLTLEAAISKDQTDEMETQRLQLVVPKSLQSSYTVAQQVWLMDLSEFCLLVTSRQ